MDFRNKVRQYYQEAIRFLVHDGEMRHALRTNDRVPAFIDNLASEFPKVNLLRFRQGKKPVNDLQVKDIVYQMTEVFITGLKSSYDQMQESDLQKIKREAAKAEEQKLERASKGIMEDEFEEMGLIVDESREQKSQSSEARPSIGGKSEEKLIIGG